MVVINVALVNEDLFHMDMKVALAILYSDLTTPMQKKMPLINTGFATFLMFTI